MTTSNELLLDHHGLVMFYCQDCMEPMTKDDIFELGMRLPDHGETRDDYVEAELVDVVRHLGCIRAAKAV